MYLIEFIIKKILQQREQTKILPSFYEENSQEELCEHVFMPVDSTSEILACTKCGLIVKQKDLKKKNFFTD
jgi:hypothetical protein